MRMRLRCRCMKLLQMELSTAPNHQVRYELQVLPDHHSSTRLFRTLTRINKMTSFVSQSGATAFCMHVHPGGSYPHEHLPLKPDNSAHLVSRHSVAIILGSFDMARSRANKEANRHTSVVLRHKSQPCSLQLRKDRQISQLCRS